MALAVELLAMEDPDAGVERRGQLGEIAHRRGQHEHLLAAQGEDLPDADDRVQPLALRLHRAVHHELGSQRLTGGVPDHHEAAML
jgi:hypothetical protein